MVNKNRSMIHTVNKDELRNTNVNIYVVSADSDIFRPQPTSSAWLRWVTNSQRWLAHGFFLSRSITHEKSASEMLRIFRMNINWAVFWEPLPKRTRFFDYFLPPAYTDPLRYARRRRSLSSSSSLIDHKYFFFKPFIIGFFSSSKILRLGKID